MSDYIENEEIETSHEVDSEESENTQNSGSRKKLAIIIAACVAAISVIALVLVLVLGGSSDEGGKDSGSGESGGKGDTEAEGEIIYNYTVNPDGKTCTIVGIKSAPDNIKKIKFPSNIDGYDVTAIGSGEEVVIDDFDDSQASILDGNGKYSYLETIEVSEGVIEIADYALYGNMALKKVILPDGLVRIGENAFGACFYLEEINIPSSVTYFGTQDFMSLISGLKCNKYGGSKYLGNKDNPYYVFWGIDSNAESNTIHKDTGILHGYLNDSKCIIVEEGNKIVKSIDGNLYSADGKTLLQYATASSNTVLHLPAEVTTIAEGACENSRNLTQVIIPTGVSIDGSLGLSVIEADAFKNCSGLVSINIPDSVESIGESAFDNCSSLESFNIPSGLTSIEKEVFSSCDSLTSISLPDGIVTIGENAFCDCKTLTEISLPSGLESIGKSAFVGCALTSIIIPDSVTSIGDMAFKWCAFEAIELPEGLTELGKEVFSNCINLRDITLPSNLRSIGESAFNRCSSLEKIELPSSVTSIGDRAFYECRALFDIEIPKNVSSIGRDAFCYCTSLSNIKVNSANQSYKSVSGSIYSKDGKTLVLYAPGKKDRSFTIPDGVTEIYNYAFSKHSVENVEIPYGVISIGEGAFYGCTKISSILLPGSVVSIGDSAFATSGIKSIDLPDSLKVIGSGAFSSSQLESVVIPDGVTKIESGVFEECTKLASITLHDNITSIGENAFNGCSSLTSFTVPKKVTTLYGNSLSNCTSLNTIYIHAGVTDIEYVTLNSVSNDEYISVNNPKGVFYDCTSLVNIEVDPANQSYKSIAGNLYTKDGKTLLQYATGKTETTFVVPSGVTTIGECAFRLCDNIKRVELCDGLETIEYEAFFECSSLESIVVPESLKSMDESAFANCRAVTDIYYKGSRSQWNDIEGTEENYIIDTAQKHYNYK